MKYETLFICLALLLSVHTASAEIIDIDPGGLYACGNITIRCGACTGNETCEECEDCGVCTIDKELHPGEHFEKQEGTCDVEMYCGYEEETKDIDRTYTFRMHVDKHGGDDIYLGVEVRDFFNVVAKSENYDWSRDSIVSITEDFNFTCPTEVVFENIDADTCAGFFEEYYTDKDPLSMMLAKDMAVYRDRFLACEDNKSKIEWQIAHYEELYHNCDNLRQNAVSDANRLNDTVITMKKDITGQVTREKQGEVTTYMWIAIVGWVCFFVLLGSILFGGGW
jgi:hypothetical protein